MPPVHTCRPLDRHSGIWLFISFAVSFLFIASVLGFYFVVSCRSSTYLFSSFCISLFICVFPYVWCSFFSNLIMPLLCSLFRGSFFLSVFLSLIIYLFLCFYSFRHCVISLSLVCGAHSCRMFLFLLNRTQHTQ